MKIQFMLKRLKFTLVLVCFLVVSSSCSDDTELFNAADQLNVQLNEKQSVAKAAQKPVQTSITVSTTDCTIDCIEVGEESGATSTTGNYQRDGSVTVDISNTATHVIFRYGSDQNIKQVKVNDDQIYCGGREKMDTESFSYSIPIADLLDSWVGCETVKFIVLVNRTNCSGGGPGNEVSFEASHILVPTCCDDESFSVVATNDNLDLLFTYDGEVALSDAMVEFTFPQIMNLELNEDGKYLAPDGKLYTVNNPTNQTVFTWIGDIACIDEEAETFEFSHIQDCSAGNANDGEAVIWTDMKVNGVSVKNGTSPVKYLLCPVN